MKEVVERLGRERALVLDWPIEKGTSELLSVVDEQGFLVLRVEGLAELTAQAYAASREFFALPREEKLALHFNDQPQGEFGNVGYFPPNLETAVGQQVADPKEFFHVGRVDDPADPSVEFYGATPWPSSTPAFPEAFRQLYAKMDAIGQDVIVSLMAGVGCGADRLGDVVKDGNSILRALHYPAATSEWEGPRPQWRAAPHVGIQMVGVQLPPTEPGLQFYSDAWGWVEPDFTEFQDCVFVNIGQMLEEMSGERFQPTLHAVRNPHGAEEESVSRYSIVFFCHANLRGPAFRVTGDGVEESLGKRWGDLLLQRLEELKLR